MQTFGFFSGSRLRAVNVPPVLLVSQLTMHRDSSVTSYVTDDRGSIPIRSAIFSSLKQCPDRLWIPLSLRYSISFRVKKPEREADHSSPPCTDAKDVPFFSLACHVCRLYRMQLRDIYISSFRELLISE
jgi:hypothetical protein